MRRDSLYLRDIVEAADAIAGFLAGVKPDQFAASDLMRSAVLQKLMVIGEAAANVSAETRIQAKDVQWRQIVAFRNLVVHRYFRIEWNIAWTTATEDVPPLRARIASILEIVDSGGAGG